MLCCGRFEDICNDIFIGISTSIASLSVKTVPYICVEANIFEASVL